ncbi:MAG: hypothetical protein ACTS27_07485 [Phycisphaerales bacterium]
MQNLRSVLAAATLASCAGLAVAGSAGPVVIFSDIVGDPTSAVPGLAGVSFTSFDRPYRSPNGDFWILTADTDAATTEDEVVIAGFGLTGAVVAREGGTISDRPDLIGFIDQRLSINDAGDFVFATNTDGDTANDEVILRGAITGGGMITTGAQESDAVVLGGGGSANLSSSVWLGDILSDGRIAYGASLTNQTSGGTGGLLIDRTVIAQADVDVPGMQAGGAMETWDIFDFQDFRTSADGSSWLAQGDLNGATTGDDVIVVNGNVVLQEEQVIGGLASTISTISEGYMDSAGNWMARGSNDDGQDWAVMNGGLIASTGEAITSGASETWSDAPFSSTFFFMASNNNGDYVLGGTTSNPDVEADAVLVLNGTTVLLRQGDAVDLNGNGLMDDDAFIDIFNNDDGFLTDDGFLYFTADLYNGAGDALGQAFMRYTIPAPGALSVLGLAGLAAVRRRR